MIMSRNDAVSVVFRCAVEPQFAKWQRTREIGLLYRGSAPYILKSRAGEYRSLYRGLRYIEVPLKSELL